VTLQYYHPKKKETYRAYVTYLDSDECVEEGWAKGKSKAVASAL
jgi:hypothetical protein